MPPHMSSTVFIVISCQAALGLIPFTALSPAIQATGKLKQMCMSAQIIHPEEVAQRHMPHANKEAWQQPILLGDHTLGICSL